MAVILPVIAVLSVTSEWSQRTGLTTFTFVPGRGRVIAAKAAVLGRHRRRLDRPRRRRSAPSATSSARRSPGVDTVWDVSPLELLMIVLANVIGLLRVAHRARPCSCSGRPIAVAVASARSATSSARRSRASTPSGTSRRRAAGHDRAGQRARPARRLHARRAAAQLGGRDRRLLRLRLRAGRPHRAARRLSSGSPTCSPGSTSTTPRAPLFDGVPSAEQWAQLGHLRPAVAGAPAGGRRCAWSCGPR